MSTNTESWGDSVWSRSGSDTISRRLFMTLYGLFTLLGLGVTAVVSFFTAAWVHKDSVAGKMVYDGPMPFWVLVIGVVAIGWIGIGMALKSDEPIVSFFGYMLVAAPFGLLMGPVFALYTAASIVKVLLVTGGLVGVFTLIGALYPESLESWGAWLFGGLIVLLIGQFGIPLMGWLIPGFPITGALHLWDWVGILLFSAYVIYDVNQAMRVPATVDNSIDAALALYLDIINLVIRLLEIMGTKKD